MRIGVIGTGYVGLVTGTCLANSGLDVTCVDIDTEKVRTLKDGRVPFYEPGLEELVVRNLRSGRLAFTSDIQDAIEGAEAMFLAVGTPMSDDGSADLSYLFSAAQGVADAAQGDLVLVTKSTVPVGTAQAIKEHIAGRSAFNITVASNPEFLKEGDAVNDFLKPDRIVIGTDDEKSRALLDRIYRPFMLREYRVIHMDVKSAEMTKYAANAMLATRISFMNDIANLCERTGATVDLVRKGISTDRRIGSAFLYPGVGYGGSCFPKDVQALINTARQAGHPLAIMEAVDAVNRRQRGVMLEKLLAYFGGDVRGKTFAIWGLAFKPRTDDIREAPAIALIEGLLSAGARVRGFDRAALENTRKHFAQKSNGELPEALTLVEDEYAAVDDADVLVLMTEWPEFRLPAWEEVSRRMSHSVLFDGRNIYEPEAIRARGFEYFGIGRPYNEAS